MLFKSDAQVTTVANQVAQNGFAIIPDIYSVTEVASIISTINAVDTEKDTFRRSADLFAIRQFLKEVPGIVPLIFNSKLRQLITGLFGPDYFVVKSIYFDKPETSNWYVAYHQDLTISVDKKIYSEGFGPWTVKQGQFAVQPPLEILEDNSTLRVHLDDTTRDNGALKIIAGSHNKGISRPQDIDWATETETICEVPAGGVMLMKPLLMHSSARTTDNRRRRVIHIEMSRSRLPSGLNWSEFMLMS